MSRIPAWPVVRILVLGDSDAGKTRLVQAITAPHNNPVNFQSNIQSTVGCSPQTMIYNSRSCSTNVFIEFFDIGGHRKWRDSRPVWYRDYAACIFVFDLTNARSYQHLPQWIDELNQSNNQSINQGLKDMPAICIGTKIDLVQTSTDRAYDPMRDFGLELIKTSMKTATIQTIDTFIEKAIKQVVNPTQSILSTDSLASPAQQRRTRTSQRINNQWEDDNDVGGVTICIDDFEKLNGENNQTYSNDQIYSNNQISHSTQSYSNNQTYSNNESPTYVSSNSNTNQLLAFTQSQSSRNDSMFSRILPSMRSAMNR